VTPDRWQEIQAVFLAAADLAPAAQAAYVAEACAADPTLRDEVLSLLAAERRSAGTAFITDAVAGAAQGVGAAERAARIGERVGPYRLVREIGHGGMGTVYLAERVDEQYHASVAIKFVRGTLAAPDLARRFRAERQILADLTHPNIAWLLDGGTASDGTPYLVMEYVEGAPIDAWCDQRRLGLGGRLALFQQVCAAVQYAHQALVVHRDLKPSNILVTTDGTPKLVDFGIAKILAEGRDAEVTGTMRLLTPAYGAPEQASGGRITVATDVYALGAVLYKLLTGRQALDLTDATPGEIERRICEEVPPPPSAAATGVPTAWRRRLRGDLDTIVLKALRKEPERRYGSVEQLADDLRRHAAGRPVLARPDTLAYRASRFVGRHRWGVGTAAALVALTGFYTARLARERDYARTEATKAAAVADFLKGLFEVSDPSQSRGNSVTARELLDRGALRIAAGLADQPGVQAQMMRVVGEVYGSLDLTEQARPLLLGALEKSRALYGPNGAEVAATLLSTGVMWQNSGERVAAESAFHEALRIRQRLAPHDDAAIAPVQSRLAYLVEGSGRYAEAERLYRDALARSRRLYAPDDPRVATILVRLGGLLRQTDRFDDAEPLLREAVEAQRRHYGRVHPRVASAVRNLAALRRDQGDFEEADTLYREAIAIRRALYGNEHQDVATTLHSYALLLQRKGEHARALATFTEVVAMLERLHPRGHPNLGVGHYDLGVELRDQGRYDEAAAHLRRAISMNDRFLAPEHPDRGEARRALASVLMAQRRYRAAEPILREALTLRRAARKPDDRSVRETETELAACLAALRRFAEAEALLLPAYEALRSSADADSGSVQAARRQLVALYEAWGKPVQAERLRVP
jgi:serine/threonine-protein kinase